MIMPQYVLTIGMPSMFCKAISRLNNGSKYVTNGTIVADRIDPEEDVAEPRWVLDQHKADQRAGEDVD